MEMRNYYEYRNKSISAGYPPMTLSEWRRNGCPTYEEEMLKLNRRQYQDMNYGWPK